jgi:AcrR family transcriptional regulator
MKGVIMGIHERKEREKEHRKEEIIDAAQQVFFEKGLLVSTMDEIADAAELSKGTLYVYYKSKEDLYLAVMMRGMQKLNEMFQRVSDSNDSTLKKIVNIGEAYNEFFKTSPNFFRMFHFSQIPHFHKQVSEEMREVCTLGHRKLWDIVIGLFKCAIDEKLIHGELNPVELAIILWSSSTALMLRMDAESEIWMERMRVDLSETLKLSNSLLWSAMLTDKGRNELALISNMKTFN